MKLRMKCDFFPYKAGEEIDVDQAEGCRLQTMGAADVIAHEPPRTRAPKMTLKETPQSKALSAQMEKKNAQ